MAGRIADALGSVRMLELPVVIGRLECPAVALFDIVATHCFLSERLAQLSNLYLDMSARLDIHLSDGEQCACPGVACKVGVTFASGIV